VRGETDIQIDGRSRNRFPLTSAHLLKTAECMPTRTDVRRPDGHPRWSRTRSLESWCPSMTLDVCPFPARRFHPLSLPAVKPQRSTGRTRKEETNYRLVGDALPFSPHPSGCLGFPFLAPRSVSLSLLRRYTTSSRVDYRNSQIVAPDLPSPKTAANG